MIRKSGNRFSDKIMLNQEQSMIRKSGNRFSDKIMLNREQSMIRKSGYRFSDKLMLKSRAVPVHVKMTRQARSWSLRSD
jgi:hypothetical protein